VSIGQALADAREKSGMTLEQVAAATRIRRTVIESIEHDNYAPCGGDFYARGHIRNIARTVGTDPAPLLAEFDSGHEPPDGTPTKTIFESEVRPPRERRMNWSAAMAVALVLVLGFGIYRVVTAAPGGTDGAANPPNTATPSASASVPQTTKPKPTSSAVAQAPRSGVTVVVRGTGGKSWLSVRTGANKQAFQGLIGTGQSKTFTDAKALHLTIGNAGAVELVVNGRSIGHPGGLGKVIRVDFGPGDPAAG
jgi:cytoskeletal protein RodZ